MRLEIYNDVYKWLVSIGVLQPDKNHATKNNGKTEIDENQSMAFYSGMRMGDLLSKVDPRFQADMNAAGQTLKDANTPTTRLYNWNVLTERLRRIGVELDADIKQLIVGGDLEMVGEVLRDVYQIQKQRGAMPPQQTNNTTTKPLAWEQQKKEVRVDQLTSVRPLHQTESVLEFVLLSLCHNLNLKPVQAQQLLANNNKLLTHICLKGVKGQYTPVVSWLQEVYTNWGKLVQLCEDEEVNIQMLLNVLKPALLSKDDDVVQWVLRIYAKLTSELAAHDKLFHVYQWAIKESAGLNNLVQCYQKQPHLAQQIAEVLLQISRYDMNEFFGASLDKNFDTLKPALEFLAALLPYLTQSVKLKESLVEMGLLQRWLDSALKAADMDTRDQRMAALGFLTTVWSLYPQWMDLNVLAQNQVLALVQKASHDNSQILRIFAVVHAFKMLDSLASQKIYSASLVYRKLTFILVENYDDFVIRELMFQQLRYLLTKYPSIPVDLLIEPIVKHIQTSYNISDLQFFTALSSHPNLKVNSAIMMLDCLVRIYNTNFLYANAVSQPIQQLVKKFIEKAEFQEFVAKLSTVSLQIYQSSVKNKRAIRNSATYKLDEESTINAQKRALIIELIKYIINLHSYGMNQLLKPILVAQHLELRQVEKQDNKGIMVLLTLLGNPDNIIEDVVQQHGIDKLDLSRSRNVNESELFLDKKLTKMTDQNPRNPSGIYVTQRDDEEAMVSQLMDEQPMNASRYQGTTNQRQFGKPYSDPQFHKKLSPIQNDEWISVYPEGDLQFVDVPPSELILVNLDEEEDLDKQSIDLMLKSYYKTLRYLFQKYSISEQAASKKRLLKADPGSSQLRIQDIFRMLRDFDVQDFTNYEEVIQLVTNLNKRPIETQPQQALKTVQAHEIGYNSLSNNSFSAGAIDQSYLTQESQSQQQERTSKLRLDQVSFGKFMSQFAMLIFSRKPFDMRQSPAGQMLQELFKYFSSVARKNGENNLIFDDPDGTTTVADKHTINRWNMELTLHPEIEVPESTNMRKMPQDEIVFSFAIKKNTLIGVKDSYLMCYELVSEILSSKFKTGLVEAKSQVKTVQRVKPLKPLGVHKDDVVDPLVIRQENLKASLATVQIREKPQRKPFYESQLNRSLEMSLSPDNFMRSSQMMSASTKVINKYKQLKDVESQEKMVTQEIKQQKWQKHKDYLDKQHSKIKDFKFQQEIDRVEKQRKQIEDAQKAKGGDKLYESTVLPLLNKKMEKVKKYKSELFVTLKKKEEEEKLKQQELEKQRLLEQKQFFKNVTKHEMDKMKVVVEQKHDNEKQQKEKEEKVKEKLKAYMERAGTKKTHYKALQDKKIEFNQKFKTLYKDPAVQTSFKNFAKRGGKVFKYFTQYSDTLSQMSKRMDITAWMEFTRTFNLQPDVLTEQQAKNIFQKTLDEKNHILEVQSQNEFGNFDKETAIDYFEFEFALLRLTIKAQAFFTKVVAVKDKIVILNALRDFKQSKIPRDQIKRLAKIDEVKAAAVEGLVNYLDIPENTEGINARLRHLQNLDENLTKPRLVLKDVKKAREEGAIPGKPKDRAKKGDWKEPGTHMKLSKEEQEAYEKEKKEKEDKRKKFPFIKKHNDVEQIQQEIEKTQKQKEKEKEDEEKKAKEREERKKKKEGK